ncbi:neuraminidase-like domain-containing protein [Klebsiella aerogenes]|uniref:Tc toxin subunit A-related protein n=1 Tax=Klebsiella aerogenes TaxID=548 RepID=UPI000665BE6D|nr:neuraminidase-like domain-containing protein [Klebsiella aerogenes]
MQRIKHILNKLDVNDESQYKFLASLLPMSFSEIRKLTESKITWSESHYLYKKTQDNQCKNRITSSRILSRSNPQLQSARHLGIKKSPLTKKYNDLLNNNADNFVKADSVASMFSPAAYLTELYREARNIEPKNPEYHLDTRRPDLANLALTQDNLDSEISTLSLSNELLLKKIDKPYDEIMEILSTYRFSGETPYNESYEAVRQSVLLQDSSLTALNHAPDVISLSDSASLSAFKSDISPELYSILIEDIKKDSTETEINSLWTKNFGKTDAGNFNNINYIANYYDIAVNELYQLMHISDSAMGSNSQYVNNKYTAIINKGLTFQCLLIDKLEPYSSGIDANYFEIIPLGEQKFNININLNSLSGDIDQSNFFFWITTPKGGKNLIIDGGLPEKFNLNTHYSLQCTIADSDYLSGDMDIHLSDKTHNLGASFKVTDIPFKSYLLCLNKIIRLYKSVGFSSGSLMYVIERNGGIFNINEDTLRLIFYIQSSMMNYNLNISQALALTYAGICTYSIDGEPSLFNRLFNDPPLGGKYFKVTNKPLDLTPGVEDDSFSKNVIKRGFGINDSELVSLWQLATGTPPTDFILSQENLSNIYTVRLLAKINNLSIIELSMLLSVSSYANIPISKLTTYDDLGKFIYFIGSTLSWLKEQKWSVSDLFIMITNSYSKELSTEITDLLSALRDNLDINQLIHTNLKAILTFQLNGWGDGDSAEVSLISLDAKGTELSRNTVSVAPQRNLWTSQQVTLELPPENAFLEIEVKAVHVAGKTTDVHFDDFQLKFSEPLSVQIQNPSAETGDLSGWVRKSGDFRVIQEQDGILPAAGRYYFTASNTATSTQEDIISQRLDIASILLINKVAPLIAASVQLDSNQKAISMLLWVDMLKPAGLSLSQFIAVVLKTAPSDAEIAKIITFCQTLGQLALVVKATSISEWVFKLITDNPKILDAENDTLLNDLRTLQLITRFNAFVHNCGKMANNVLGEMARLDLTPRTLSEAMVTNEKEIVQVLSIIKSEHIIDYRTVDIIQQWIDIASALKISPNDINALIKLNYIVSQKEGNSISYVDWIKISEAMQSGLSPYQTTRLTQYLEERKSSALSCYLMTEKYYPATCSTRDSLYAYLLIDNKISAQITTTRIAEAIASVQLYINSALSGDMDGISDDLRTRQFFVEWDTYNKRYSTWAGVSLLSYYPENYIDPTIRIGQTHMMDTLLQSVTQNGVNKDTVEDAFKAYLTSFEQVANLDVISGYHDAPNLNNGLTYFIGRNNAEQVTYYWRSVDHSKMQNGVIAANAWSEWSSIENAMVPYDSHIRPIIFNNRLYVSWIEKIIKTDSSAVEKGEYVLKLSHIRYDGSWSTPTSFNLSDEIIKIADNTLFTDYYCTVDTQNELLYILFYSKEKKYTGTDSNYCNIVAISAEMDMVIDSAITDKVYNNCYMLFDLDDNRLVNRLYVEGLYHVSSSDEGPGKVINGISLGRSFISQAKLGDVKNGNLPFNTELSFCCDLIENSGDVPFEIYDLFKDYITDENTFYYSSITFYYCDNSPSYYYLIIGVDKETLNMVFEVYHDWDQTRFDVSQADINYCNIRFNNEVNLNAKLSATHKITRRQFDLLLSNDVNNAFLDSCAFKDPRFVSGNVYHTETDRMVFRNLRPSLVELVNNSEMSIKLDVSDGSKKEFDATTWFGGKPNVIIGNNSFISKSGVLEIDIPIDSFIQHNDLTLDITLAIKNKSNNLISSYYFTYDIAKLGENGVIALKSNDRGAQYLSMQLNKADSPCLVRLNTLFARQLVARANTGIDTILSLSTQNLPEPKLEGSGVEPMDFSGANALYFWELFFYTPMMVVNTLLQDNNFTEARRWLKYVFSPNGYIDSGVYDDRNWNVRPLLEDTSWNEAPLDSNDPDAVAQNDPMHYKVFAFMKMIDLIVMQGDIAYRRLERDSLNEAKMWYMQAISLLGDETPVASNSNWGNPVLGVAADATTQNFYQHVLMVLDAEADIETPFNANSLSSLFFPQLNEMLDSYRKTLIQRIYNLRHNLSIDGQPLSLPIYTTPSDPKALLTAAVSSSLNGGGNSITTVPLHHFSTLLDNAKGMVNQLIQFGNTLLSLCERQDAEGLAQLLQTQGSELILQNIAIQISTIQELDAEKETLLASREAANIRAEHYGKLFDENISANESQAMELYFGSSIASSTASGLYMGGAIADLAPNIFGVAVGGSRWGGICNAIAMGIEIGASVTRISADKISQSETYRRRREEWMLLRDTATAEIKQVDTQLNALSIRQEAANMQKVLLETQQSHSQAQLAFLQTKFTSQSLYSWLRGSLMAIYSPFYDLAVSRCLMVEQAWCYELNEARTFVRPSAWQGTYSGLLAGENLMLMLGQMETAYLEKDKRALEVTRTVSLASVYAGLGNDKAFTFDDITDLVNKGATGMLGDNNNGVNLNTETKTLNFTFKLDGLEIHKDYPQQLGDARRIRQISITLPTLLAPYQDIRAILSYGGNELPASQGREHIAISHGMNDSGQFQLDFNDTRYLPFEGLPVNGQGTFGLQFPDAVDGQKTLLQNLSDVILHIRYTIR